MARSQSGNDDPLNILSDAVSPKRLSSKLNRRARPIFGVSRARLKQLVKRSSQASKKRSSTPKTRKRKHSEPSDDIDSPLYNKSRKARKNTITSSEDIAIEKPVGDKITYENSQSNSQSSPEVMAQELQSRQFVEFRSEKENLKLHAKSNAEISDSEALKSGLSSPVRTSFVRPKSPSSFSDAELHMYTPAATQVVTKEPVEKHGNELPTHKEAIVESVRKHVIDPSKAPPIESHEINPARVIGESSDSGDFPDGYPDCDFSDSYLGSYSDSYESIELVRPNPEAAALISFAETFEKIELSVILDTYDKEEKDKSYEQTDILQNFKEEKLIQPTDSKQLENVGTTDSGEIAYSSNVESEASFGHKKQPVVTQGNDEDNIGNPTGYYAAVESPEQNINSTANYSSQAPSNEANRAPAVSEKLNIKEPEEVQVDQYDTKKVTDGKVNDTTNNTLLLTIKDHLEVENSAQNSMEQPVVEKLQESDSKKHNELEAENTEIQESEDTEIEKQRIFEGGESEEAKVGDTEISINVEVEESQNHQSEEPQIVATDEPKISYHLIITEPEAKEPTVQNTNKEGVSSVKPDDKLTDMDAVRTSVLKSNDIIQKQFKERSKKVTQRTEVEKVPRTENIQKVDQQVSEMKESEDLIENDQETSEKDQEILKENEKERLKSPDEDQDVEMKCDELIDHSNQKVIYDNEIGLSPVKKKENDSKSETQNHEDQINGQISDVSTSPNDTIPGENLDNISNHSYEARDAHQSQQQSDNASQSSSDESWKNISESVSMNNSKQDKDKPSAVNMGKLLENALSDDGDDSEESIELVSTNSPARIDVSETREKPQAVAASSQDVYDIVDSDTEGGSRRKSMGSNGEKSPEKSDNKFYAKKSKSEFFTQEDKNIQDGKEVISQSPVSNNDLPVDIEVSIDEGSDYPVDNDKENVSANRKEIILANMKKNISNDMEESFLNEMKDAVSSSSKEVSINPITNSNEINMQMNDEEIDEDFDSRSAGIDDQNGKTLNDTAQISNLSETLGSVNTLSSNLKENDYLDNGNGDKSAQELQLPQNDGSKTPGSDHSLIPFDIPNTPPSSAKFSVFEINTPLTSPTLSTRTAVKRLESLAKSFPAIQEFEETHVSSKDGEYMQSNSKPGLNNSDSMLKDRGIFFRNRSFKPDIPSMIKTSTISSHKITCKECFLPYVPGLAPDKTHEVYHSNYLNGLSWNDAWGRSVGMRELPLRLRSKVSAAITQGDSGVKEVRLDKKPEVRVAIQLLAMTNTELNAPKDWLTQIYGDNLENFNELSIKKAASKGKVLVYILNRKVVGIASFESINTDKLGSKLMDVKTQEVIALKKSSPLVQKMPKVLFGVSRLYVISRFRKLYIASIMLYTALGCLVYGMYLNRYQISWSQPSSSGLAVAKKFNVITDVRSKRQFLNVYE